jgi:hypothetical protein
MAFSGGVNQPGREADHSLLSSAEVNEWRYTPSPPICLHGVDRDTFNLRKMIFGNIPVGE